MTDEQNDQVEEPKYSSADMGSLIPADTRVQFDVRTVLARILDGSRFDEFKVPFFSSFLLLDFFFLIIICVETVWRYFGYWFWTVVGHACWNRGEQRHFVFAVCSERSAFHSIVFAERNSADFLAKHYWFHGWKQS